MDKVQMLVPIDPNDFWRKMKTIVEEVLLDSKKKTPVDRHSDRPLLKVKEVCEIFHISKPTIYDWLKQGKLESIKIRSRRYFHWHDVEQLINESKVNPLKAHPGKQPTRLHY